MFVKQYFICNGLRLEIMGTSYFGNFTNICQYEVQERSAVVRSTIILLLRFSVCSNKHVF